MNDKTRHDGAKVIPRDAKRPLWWALSAAILAAVALDAPNAFTRPRIRPSLAKEATIRPQRVVNGSLAKQFGIFAYTNSQGLFSTTATGSLLHISRSSSATDPLWSFNGQYLAFETTGQDGLNAVLHVYEMSTHRVILSVSHVNAFAWQPRHNLLSVMTSKLQLIALQGSRILPIATISGPIEAHYIWSSQGTHLAYAITEGAVGNRHDVVDEVTVSHQGLSSPVKAWRSPKEEGVWLAAFLPQSRNILFWPDGQYSASLMADGAPLQLWHQKSGRITTYPSMLPYRDYLTVPHATQFALMAGGPRTISGSDKAIVFVHHGLAHKLSNPPGKEVIEPNLNPTTGQIVAVVADNDTGASWGLLASYHQWVKTRELAVFSHHHWVVWTNAGRGVTDPVWAPNDKGVLYLTHNWLFYLGGETQRPQAVLGPIPSTGGYYGEVLRSSLWDLLPLPTHSSLSGGS